MDEGAKVIDQLESAGLVGGSGFVELFPGCMVAQMRPPGEEWNDIPGRMVDQANDWNTPNIKLPEQGEVLQVSSSDPSLVSDLEEEVKSVDSGSSSIKGPSMDSYQHNEDDFDVLEDDEEDDEEEDPDDDWDEEDEEEDDYDDDPDLDELGDDDWEEEDDEDDDEELGGEA